MINSHKGNAAMNGYEPPPSAWKPVRPPPRGENDPATLNAFHAYILTPGFSLAFHAATLNRSLTSIASYRAKATKAAQANPAIMEMVRANVRAIGPEQGLAMGQVRGPAQMPFWSRLAIRDYRKRGWKRREIAEAFHCSLGTVVGVLAGTGQAYAAFSGERQLSYAQMTPAGRWSSTKPCALSLYP